MDKNYVPGEVLANPQSDALKQEMKHWEIVKTSENGRLTELMIFCKLI